jgi:hypothetical protein
VPPAASGSAAAPAQPPPTEPAPTTEPTPPAPPPETQLGGPGESCRARADCRTGLKCVSSVCRDEREGTTCGSTAECGGELKCVQNVCTSQTPGALPGYGGPQPDEGESWTAFEIGKGMNPFVGITVAGGPAMGLLLGGGGTSDVEGSFLFALRGGVVSGKTEFGIELSPMTFLYVTAADPSFQVNAFIGYYAQIADRLYWPLRIGAGMAAANTPGDRVFFQARADLVGVMYNVGHLMLELHAPTYRFATEFQDLGLFIWDVGLSASYAL